MPRLQLTHEMELMGKLRAGHARPLLFVRRKTFRNPAVLYWPQRKGENAMLPILIVDDEPHIARLIEMTLEPLGQPLVLACDGEQAADLLEKAEDFNAALHELLCRTFRDHQRIIFNGNGYEEAWVKEAERRGLSNHTCTADALRCYLKPEHVALFTRHGVFTREELAARNEIHLENYCEVIGIELSLIHI